jgi:hypothetical protein
MNTTINAVLIKSAIINNYYYIISYYYLIIIIIFAVNTPTRSRVKIYMIYHGLIFCNNILLENFLFVYNPKKETRYVYKLKYSFSSGFKLKYYFCNFILYCMDHVHFALFPF